MKKKLLLQLGILAGLALSFSASAQNADEIIYNQNLSSYNYVAGSFVIDSGISQTNKKRAFLIWANNLQPDTLKRFLSLSEYDGNLNFLTEQGNPTEKFGSVKSMFPKKIIKSKFERAYYLLAYVANSSHPISGFSVFSSPVIFKIDAATLGLKWARKINLAAINPNNLNTVIEYNDMIETSDKNIVLVGKYANNVEAKESVLATKIKGSNGALVWQYVYKTGNQCNEAANSVAETKDRNLSLTGYVKKCTTSVNGNEDVFYMELQATGIPVPAAYERFFWPSNLNMHADKITCYTSSAGSDQLIISGYIDIQGTTGIDRQILIMNLKQSGALVTAQYAGTIKTDVCNDLIFKKNGSTGTSYLIYLTGQTFTYPQDSMVGKAYFMYGKFDLNKGLTGISEFSTFPNSKSPTGSRTGVEIKNAGDYKKFAILATGTYQPVVGGPGQTFSNVLIRDLNDTSGSCIKKQRPPLKQFNLDRTFSTAALDTPFLRVYKETWVKLSKLIVEKSCQYINVDPSHALNVKAPDNNETPSVQTLRVSPNPAQSLITLTMADGSKLAGNYKNAVIEIYNYAMQAEKIITVSPSQGSSIQLPVGQLKPGVYWIQLTRDNEKLGCSFVKE